MKYLLLVPFLLSTCKEAIPPKKPFTITSIYAYFYSLDSDDVVKYTYIDSLGRVFSFDDLRDSYNIGDTIK